MRRLGAILLAMFLSAALGCEGGRAPLNPRQLTRGAGDKFAPDFSPDGKSIVFVKRVADNEAHLWVVGIADGRERRLTWAAGVDGEPAWSHDGTRVAFQSNRAGRGASNIYVVSADMGEKRGSPRAVPLTEDNALSGAPAWSPDDSRLAFESTRAGNLDVWVMNADGEGAGAVTRSPEPDTSPRWSPDGKWIAFSSSRSGARELWVMDPEGSLPRQLTTGGVASWRPRWTPDSAELIFMRAAGPGAAEFYQVLRNGTGLKQVVAGAASLRDPAVSPDGKWLAFSANPDGVYQIFLLKLGR